MVRTIVGALIICRFPGFDIKHRHISFVNAKIQQKHIVEDKILEYPPGSSRVRIHAQVALCVALSTVLDMVSNSLPFPRMPYGGTLSIATVPMIIIALRMGWRIGSITGVLYGIVALLREQHFIHPIQLLLDYPLAFSTIGAAGIVRCGSWQQTDVRIRIRIGVAVVVANTLRFCTHFLSGIVFWYQFAAEGQSIWMYSLIYNASYMVPETIIGSILVQVLLRRLRFL